MSKPLPVAEFPEGVVRIGPSLGGQFLSVADKSSVGYLLDFQGLDPSTSGCRGQLLRCRLVHTYVASPLPVVSGEIALFEKRRQTFLSFRALVAKASRISIREQPSRSTVPHGLIPENDSFGAGVMRLVCRINERLPYSVRNATPSQKC
jgi:hypothetical protein